MVDLHKHGRKVSTIFHLLGEKENDITFSVGWALSQSRTFLDRFLHDLFPSAKYPNANTILLQEHSKKPEQTGITDIEIWGDSLHCIVEAKRGWTLPNLEQLEKYAGRIERQRSSRSLVVLSECSPAYASRRLPQTLDGTQVLYRSWKQIEFMAKESYIKAGHAEKRLLLELRNYLRSLMNMQNQKSNEVFLVSLSGELALTSTLTWIEIVTKKRKYFHPHGRGWPLEPPNYLGFHYHGKLQSIHHVERYEVVTEFHKHIPEIPPNIPGEGNPHLLYWLGQAFRPANDVLKKGIWPSGRKWAMLDTLFTCDTIAEATLLSQKRLQETEY